MKRLTWACGIVWAVALTGALNAQKPESRHEQAPPKPAAPAAKPQHVEGSVKSLPIETTFVVTTSKNGEVTVKEHVAQLSKKLGDEISVRRFLRFQVGETIAA